MSPLLSNILLDELDKELEKRGHRFCRYADDCNIYVRSKRAGERVMRSVSQFLIKRLKLKVNSEKSAIDRPWKRKFLGYSMTFDRQPRLKVAPVSDSKTDSGNCSAQVEAAIWPKLLVNCILSSLAGRTIFGLLRSRVRLKIWTDGYVVNCVVFYGDNGNAPTLDSEI
jgi:hypothetical protein